MKKIEMEILTKEEIEQTLENLSKIKVMADLKSTPNRDLITPDVFNAIDRVQDWWYPEENK